MTRASWSPVICSMYTYISGLDVVPEEMIRVQIDPWVDEKCVAFVENIEAIPCRVECRPKFRYEVNALNDVFKGDDFRACLPVAHRVCECMHLGGGVDSPERPKPFHVRKALGDRRNSLWKSEDHLQPRDAKT